MAREVKICGLSTAETVAAALSAGADWIGFVFFARSPRNVPVETAARLAEPARGLAGIVALTVDASDAELAAIVAGLRPDLLQLHGKESPERVAAIRARFNVPVMKVIAVATEADLAPVAAYAAVADRLLFDAKPPPSLAGALPGGNGVSFDWQLIRGLDPGKPYMLSGGLDPDNVAAAIAATGVTAVDVSSGVESAPGVKDAGRIRAFVRAAKLDPPQAKSA